MKQYKITFWDGASEDHLTDRGGCLIEVLRRHWFIGNFFCTDLTTGCWIQIGHFNTCNTGLNVTKTLQKLALLSRGCFLQNAHLCFPIWSTIVVVSLSRQKFPYPVIMSRGCIFTVWTVVWKVAPANNHSIFYHACPKFVTQFTSKINHQVCPHGQMAWVSQDEKKATTVVTTLIWHARLTQCSKPVKNRKKPIFLIYSSRFLEWMDLNICWQRLLFARQITQRKHSLCSQGTIAL